MSKEAMELALEALELNDAPLNNETVVLWEQKIDEAIIALREALASEAIEQPAQQEQEPVALGSLAKRRVFDYIRGAYDLGYNDARNAKTIPGDDAPGYKGREVESDHGGALLNALESIASPPASQSRSDVKPLTEYEIDCIRFGITAAHHTEHAIKLTRAIEAAHGIVSTEDEGELK